MEDNIIYTPEEQLYLILEIKKVFENHRKIPNLFIYPTKKFTFEVIYFENCVKKFRLIKSTIQDTWKIEMEDSIIDSNYNCIYEILNNFITENIIF